MVRAQKAQTSQESPEALEATTLSLSLGKLFTEGRFDEALPVAKRVLEIREKLLATDDPQIDVALNNLAEVYFGMKDYGAAKKVFERLLSSMEKKLGPEDVTLGPILDKLAFLSYSENDFHRTEELYKRALSLREKKQGPSSADVGLSLFNLAEYYRFRLEYSNAAPRFDRALTIYGQLFGADSPEFEKVSQEYVCLLYESGKTEKLKDLEKIKQTYRPSDPNRPKHPIQGGVLNGRAISLPKPPYPKEAKARHLAGTIVIKVLIDEEGNVIDARDMCQGVPYLTNVSVQAAKGARFTPTKLSGQPVKVTGVIVYNFVAQ
jgi:TonB family protein